MRLVDKEDEVIEFILSDGEIKGLIKSLEMLKENKDHFHFRIDNKSELLIHHEKDEL